MRSFHRFALTDGAASGNPAEDVSPPKQARRLPHALSIGQVQALLDAPDRTTPIGLRDAALLELLYGTGARISEAVGLDVDDVSSQLDDPELGLRLFGKGRKERIVPLGSYARTALGDYLVRGRPTFIARAKRPGAGPVPQRAGGTPVAPVRMAGGAVGRRAGADHRRPWPAHPAAQFCHSSAGRRS